MCDAAESIKLRYGLKAAFDYADGEKLLHYAEAAAWHPDCALDLPPSVSWVRNMSTTEEIKPHLACIFRERREAVQTNVTVDNLDLKDSATLPKLTRQLEFAKEPLTAFALGSL